MKKFIMFLLAALFLPFMVACGGKRSEITDQVELSAAAQKFNSVQTQENEIKNFCLSGKVYTKVDYAMSGTKMFTEVKGTLEGFFDVEKKCGEIKMKYTSNAKVMGNTIKVKASVEVTFLNGYIYIFTDTNGNTTKNKISYDFAEEFAVNFKDLFQSIGDENLKYFKKGDKYQVDTKTDFKDLLSTALADVGSDISSMFASEVDDKNLQMDVTLTFDNKLDGIKTFVKGSQNYDDNEFGLNSKIDFESTTNLTFNVASREVKVTNPNDYVESTEDFSDLIQDGLI